MVKDKKKKEKQDKKKKAAQQPKEARTYFPEALLEYQIQIKEEVIDQLLYEIKRLEEIHERYLEKNQHLKAEQTGHIRALLAKLKEREKELENIEIVTREDVEKAMQEKWQYIKDQEKLIKDMRSQMYRYEQTLSVKQAEMDYWLEYKNVGSTDHAQQIQVLEQEIQKLKEDLEEMTEYFRISMEETKKKIDQFTLKQMELKKEWATENAVKHIDSISCREIKEYEWLKGEVASYRLEVEGLEAAAHMLEQENIYLTRKLVDRRMHYLRVPRKLFLTQGAGLNIAEEELESPGSRDTLGPGASLLMPPLPVESISSIGKNSLVSASEFIFTEMEEGDEVLPTSDSDSELVYLRGQTASPFLPPLLYEDAADFKEYQDLGPLEVKLMSAVGRALPLHEDFEEMPSRIQLEEKYSSNRASRQITYQMVKSAFLSRGKAAASSQKDTEASG